MKRLPLNNHKNARQTLARLIREYYHDEVPEEKMRAITYALNCLLGYFKLEADLRIEERLDAIEEQLQQDRL